MSAEKNIPKKPLTGLFTFLALAFFLGGFYFAGSMFLATSAWYIRLSVALLGAVLSIVALRFTVHWDYLISLVRGARIELRKVFWPRKDEWLKMTGLVLVIVAIFSIFLWVVDAILTFIVQLVL